jgi:hypothetical protein
MSISFKKDEKKNIILTVLLEFNGSEISTITNENMCKIMLPFLNYFFMISTMYK